MCYPIKPSPLTTGSFIYLSKILSLFIIVGFYMRGNFTRGELIILGVLDNSSLLRGFELWLQSSKDLLESEVLL